MEFELIAELEELLDGILELELRAHRLTVDMSRPRVTYLFENLDTLETEKFQQSEAFLDRIKTIRDAAQEY